MRLIPGTLVTLAAGCLLASISGGATRPATAEPYLAVRTGLRCSQCHVNRTGGGGRNDFGSIYAQTRLPIREFQFQGRSINSFLSVGADFRVTAGATTGGSDPNSSIQVDEANFYLDAQVVPDVLAVYLDQSVGPGTASTRELFGLLDLPADGYMKAGKFLLPYGLRLPDDGAFIRRRTGFTYATPDIGIEAGFEPGPFTLVAALTNGTAGASETDDGKQITGTAALVKPRYRLGASAAYNDADGDSRSVVGGFGGINLGRLTFLGEIDYIFDRFESQSNLDQFAAHVEGAFLVARGVNLRAAYGFLDPDRDIGENAQTRFQFGVEVFPTPFLILSALYTVLEDIPQATTDSDRLAIQLHAYF